MSIQDSIAVLNQMETEGVIGRYAIGGAVGALFYLEPSDTVDIDVFVTFREESDKLVSLSPLYDWLRAHGFTEHRREGVVIGDWPVQFLPASDALDEDALACSVSTEVEGIPTRVMTPEHLVALALRTGRNKDYLRILAFRESGQLDEARLNELLARFGLTKKWSRFQDTFNGPLSL